MTSHLHSFIMAKVSHALNHSAMEAVNNNIILLILIKLSQNADEESEIFCFLLRSQLSTLYNWLNASLEVMYRLKTG